MKPKYQRLVWIALGFGTLSLAAFLILQAFDDNLVFFYSPHDLRAHPRPAHQKMRLGGLVEPRTVSRRADGAEFVITDHRDRVPVRYEGILPDLFREGQGVVVEGAFLEDASDPSLPLPVFRAETVFAKHDENYMPPEVASKLKDQGLWRHAQ